MHRVNGKDTNIYTIAVMLRKSDCKWKVMYESTIMIDTMTNKKSVAKITSKTRMM